MHPHDPDNCKLPTDDDALREADERINELSQHVAERDDALREADERINELSQQVAERDDALREADERINELSQQVAERDALIATMRRENESLYERIEREATT